MGMPSSLGRLLYLGQHLNIERQAISNVVEKCFLLV
ncbi:Uncharacterised protein [Bordetella pertussis]|nr:Uncharacterised protein [Bordetella pertussis]